MRSSQTRSADLVRRLLLCTTAGVATSFASPAFAQVEPPPQSIITDARGVDVVNGEIGIGGTDVSIGGGGADGLTYKRIDAKFRTEHNIVLATTIGIYGSDPRGFRVIIGDQSYGFSLGGEPAEKNGTKLSHNPATEIYTFTDADGVKYFFDGARWPSPYSWDVNGLNVLVIDRIEFPDGTVRKYNTRWEKLCRSGGNCSLSNPNPEHGNYRWVARVQSITLSNGLQLKISYVTNQSPTHHDWTSIASVKAINNAIEYCDPYADVCSLNGNWSAANYVNSKQWITVVGNNNVTTAAAINAAGRVTEVMRTSSRVSAAETTEIKFPGSASPTYVATTGSDGRIVSLNYRGAVWGYTYTSTPASGGSLLDLDVVTIQSPTGESSTQQIGSFTDFSNLFSEYLKKIVFERDAAGVSRNYTYTGDDYVSQTGILAGITRQDGQAENYAYDDFGNVISTTSIPSTGSISAPLTAGATFPSACNYAASCGKPTRLTDSRSQSWDFTYDPIHGGILTATGPADASGVRPQRRYTYAQFYAYARGAGGALVPSTNAIYRLTEVSECIQGAAPSCVGTADERRTLIAYGAPGTPNNLFPTSITTRSGDGSVSATIAYSYDTFGNIVVVDGPLHGVEDSIVYRYNAQRELVGTIGADPDGSGPRQRRAVRNNHDAAGRISSIEVGTVDGTDDAAWSGFTPAQMVSYEYDPVSRRKIIERRSAGGVTYQLLQFSYDAAGRPICSTVRMNLAAFDSLPNDACALGQQGNAGPDRITRRSYDSAGRLHEIQTGYGTESQSSEIIDYDNLGRKIADTDGEGHKTTYRYDGHDRVDRVFYPSPTTPGVSSTTDWVGWGYGATGTLDQYRLRDGQVLIYDYDALGRTTRKRTWQSGVGITETTDYAFDLLGRTTSIAKGGLNDGFTYDALGRVTYQTQPWGWVASQYDLAGRRTRVTWSDGFYATYDYDNTGAMTAVRENGASLLATYGYDDLGRRTSLTRGNGTVTNYAFDPLSRLATLSQNFASSGNNVTSTFTHLPSGQIASVERSNNAYAWTSAKNVDRAYSVNGLNQLTQSGSEALGYDLRGNLNSSGSTTYAYSAENLLTSTNTGLLFFYDGIGRLAVQYTPTDATAFLYDGGQIVTEHDKVTLAIQRRYVYGADVDEPLVWYEGSGTGDKRYLHADERGSVIAVSNASGTVTNVNRYDEYGLPQTLEVNGVFVPTNVGRFQYTGQAWLPELGMYYYKARIYSPTLGRFVQTDPIGYADGLNWYNYVGSDPVNATDPSGLDTQTRAGESEPIPDVTVTGTRSFGFEDPPGFSVELGSAGPLGQIDRLEQFQDTVVVTAIRTKPKLQKQVCDPHGSGRCWVPGNPVATKKMDAALMAGNCKLGNFLKAPGGDVVAGTVAAGTLASVFFSPANILNKTLGPVGYALSGAWLIGEVLTLANCK